MCNRNLHDYIHISIPVPLRFEHLFKWKISQSCRWIQTGNSYKFYFYRPEKTIKLAKSKIKKIKENLNETDHVSDLCKNASGKINALPRVAPYISISKCHILMNTFFKSQCNYCPLVWMCHCRINNTRINRLHKRCLRIIYNNKTSSFENIWEKDSSVSLHNRNLQVLATETFKINRGIPSSIMKGIFERRAEHPYNLRCISQFSAP